MSRKALKNTNDIGKKVYFALGSYDWKFQPCFRDEKRPNILAASSDAKCEKESKHDEKKS